MNNTSSEQSRVTLVEYEVATFMMPMYDVYMPPRVNSSAMGFRQGLSDSASALINLGVSIYAHVRGFSKIVIIPNDVPVENRYIYIDTWSPHEPVPDLRYRELILLAKEWDIPPYKDDDPIKTVMSASEEGSRWSATHGKWVAFPLTLSRRALFSRQMSTQQMESVVLRCVKRGSHRPGCRCWRRTRRLVHTDAQNELLLLGIYARLLADNKVTLEIDGAKLSPAESLSRLVDSLIKNGTIQHQVARYLVAPKSS